MDAPPDRGIHILPVINQRIDGIPLASLYDARRWVSWRQETRNGKPTKVPYNPVDEYERKAEANDPSTWGTRDDALRHARLLPNAGGIGIMLGALDDKWALGGLDLDTCRDPDTGEIDKWADEILRQFKTYSEVSPSLTGVKLLYRYNVGIVPMLQAQMGAAKHSKLWKRGDTPHPPGIEFHLSNRYFCITGQTLDWLPDEIHLAMPADLLRMLRVTGPQFANPGAAPLLSAKAAEQSGPEPEQQVNPSPLWDRIRSKAAFNPALNRLLSRDFSGMSDNSRSSRAMALGGVLCRAGFSFDDTAEALRTWPETADWMKEKGDAAGGRELQRLWAKAVESRDKPTQSGQQGDTEGGATGRQQANGMTEDEAADQFAEQNTGKLAYDHTSSIWYVWRGDAWIPDERGSAFHTARAFVRALRMEGGGGKLGKIAFAAAVERAAKHDPRIAVSQTVWDTDQWSLGVPGGVVDLRTGELREGMPEDYVSRQTIVAPAAPGTAAPMWQAFLADATRGDKDVQGFLQRLLGYCLTGDVSEEILAFIYGGGGNGKGVFVGTATAILGRYAVAMPIEAFTNAARLPIEYYRAQMAGARLVTASETEAGAAWSEAQIKELTGNEAPLSARNPYGRPFTYRPTFKLAIVGNHAPKLRGRSPAMERRLRIVPFVHEPAKPDPELKTKLVAEYPAILRWMIDGCLAWQKSRLGTASAIKAATQDYFAIQDAFARWMAEACIVDDSLRTPSGIAFSAYKAWCLANGEDPGGVREFVETVKRTKGLSHGPYAGKTMVKGLGIRPENQRHAD